MKIVVVFFYLEVDTTFLISFFYLLTLCMIIVRYDELYAEYHLGLPCLPKYILFIFIYTIFKEVYTFS